VKSPDVPVPGLLDWLDDPDENRGVSTMDAAGEWHHTGYPRLAALTKAMAAALADAGVGRGDVVSIIHRNGPGFISAFFGALALGAVPSPLVPPALFQDSAGYATHIGGILGVARPRVVVLEPDLEAALGPVVRTRLGVPTVVTGAEPGDTDVPISPPAAGDLALLQFTSGSSSAPKGVEVSRAALEAQIGILVNWLGFHSGNGCATWLPIHHDMGLVGMVLPGVITQTNLWIMQPDQFIQGAARWLRVFGNGDAHIAAMPPFSLGHMLRRVRRADLDGCDFSAVRNIVVGAEPIDGTMMDRFAELLAPYRFRPEMLAPAYGLAEATLAVAGKESLTPTTRVRVDRSRLRLGEKVIAAPDEVVPAEPLELVSCGAPLPGVRVSVCDEAGDPAPPGVLGEVVVGGNALADHYRGDGELWTEFHTGDAGFMWEDGLYVLGRLGDGLKLRGVQVFAEDLEVLLACGDAVKSARYAVVLGAFEGVDTVAAIVVKKPGPWAEEVHRTLRRAVRGVRVVVVAADRSAVRRTSSGKPMRRAMFNDLMDGTIEGVVVHDSGIRRADDDG
jgi:acyl-CoA synthetase (AMP-forming)/AMP-acid ligase II